MTTKKNNNRIICPKCGGTKMVYFKKLRLYMCCKCGEEIDEIEETAQETTPEISIQHKDSDILVHINSIGERLNIPERIRDDAVLALSLFQEVKGSIQGYSSKALAAGAVYYACKFNGFSISFSAISSSVGSVTNAEISHFYKNLVKNLGREPIFDGFIQRIKKKEVKKVNDLSPLKSSVLLTKKDMGEECATFTLPLKLPECLYDFITRCLGPIKDTYSETSVNAQDRSNLQKKHALLGIYRDITGVLMERVLSNVNRSCRTKSHTLYTHLKEKALLNSPFSLNNQQLRTLFQDSSNLGDVSTNIVQDTYKGHWEHLGRVFPIIKDIFLQNSLIEGAPYIFSGFITANLKRLLSTILGWKPDHVRGQLRGMRRLMESEDAFPAFLSLTQRTQEQQALRKSVKKFLERYTFSAQEQVIISQILGKFQANHLLHLLLTVNVYDAPLLGVCPKKLYSYPAIERNVIQTVLTRLTSIFAECRGLMTDLVKTHIAHRTVIQSRAELKIVLKEYEAYQTNYITFLKDKHYSTSYASEELMIIQIFLKELDSKNSILAEYIICGVFPSEKIIGGFAKLITPHMKRGSLKQVRKTCKSVLAKLIPLLFLKHYHNPSKIYEQFVSSLSNKTATTPPFHSPKNRKIATPLLLIMGNRYVLKRPGNPSQMKILLNQGDAVPLQFTHSLLLEYYNVHLPENEKIKSLKGLTPSRLWYVIKGLFDKKGRYPEVVSEWLHSVIAEQNSPLYKLFLQPSLELKLSLPPHQMKLRGLIEDPRITLHPLRILPPKTGNTHYNCHLIFSSPRECHDLFSLRTHLFDMNKYHVPIPPIRDEQLAIGVDINQETTANVVVISPDWNSVLRKNPHKVLQNTLKEKSFTSYVHDGGHSELSCGGVNVLSGEIILLVKRIRNIKKNIKPIQRAITFKTIQAKTGFKEFIEKIYLLSSKHGIPPTRLRALSDAVRQCPVHHIHELKQLRAQRQRELLAFFGELNARGIFSHAIEKKYDAFRTSGKHIYRLTSQLRGHQGRLNTLRKELMRLVSRIIAAVIVSERPRRFGYEVLSFSPQGLKKGLATAVQYMPKDEEISRALELAVNFYKKKGIPFDIEVIAVNPRGTSQPPHIPSNRHFQRTRSEWNVITIPEDPKNNLPELRFNSHILSSQKIAEKARIMEI